MRYNPKNEDATCAEKLHIAAGMTKDKEEVRVLLAASARRGFAKAQRDYGRLLSNDDSLIWFEAAAIQGHVNSQLILGNIFGDRSHSSYDFQKAERWYKAAAEHGSVDAQCNLGALYIDGGDGSNHHAQQAVRWLTAAASQGCIEAQYNLGLFYSDREGSTHVNELEATRWFQAAAEQGDPQAKAKLMRRSEQDEGGRDEAKPETTTFLMFLIILILALLARS